jgi:predicted acetyltransferase
VSVEVRACRPDEFERFYTVLHQAFGEEPADDDLERARRVLPAERTLAAFEYDTIVGTAGAYPFSLRVPGSEIPAGGVTMVGVPPSHRRRGILRSMMLAQLEDGHSRGEPIAILWASEASIYQRFGYGMATKAAHIDIERDRADWLADPPSTGCIRLLTTEDALKVLPEIYERVRADTPGMYARSSDWWEAHTLADPKENRGGAGPLFVGVWEKQGRAEAYALYRARGEWTDGMPASSLEVEEAVGATSEAVREIWRFLFGIDLVERVKAYKEPAEHPLLLMLAEPRRLRLRVKDGLWLRVIDLQAALQARSYSSDGALVFELADALCPWNEGRWRLDVAGGEGRLQRASQAPQLLLRTEDLAATYLGGVTFRELERAGRIQERTDGAVSAATAMFASPRAPWCPEIF